MSAFQVWFELAKSEENALLRLLRGRVNWEAYQPEDDDQIVDETPMRVDDKQRKKRLAQHNTRGARSTGGGYDSQVGSIRVGSGQMQRMPQGSSGRVR